MRHVLPLFLKLYKLSESSMDWLYGHRIHWDAPVLQS